MLVGLPPRAAFLASLLALSLLPWPAASPPGVEPNALPPTDVPAWFPGEFWTYDVHAVMITGADVQQVWATTTYTVAGREVITQFAESHDVYNVTLGGTFTSSGTLMGVPYSIDSGSGGGYQWLRRDDLAIVRDNQTLSGTGTVQPGFPCPVSGCPLTVDGANESRFDPPREDNDFPMAEPDRWDVTGTESKAAYLRSVVSPPLPLTDVRTLARPISWSVAVWINGTAVVTVPAGTWEAFTVHAVGTPPGNMGVVIDRWWVPSVKNAVRIETHDVNAVDMQNHAWMNLTTYGVLSSAIPVSAQAVANPVNPGGNVIVDGTTTSFATVTVRFRETNTVVTVTANAGGGFSVALVAPLVDDDTPTPFDEGSHGIIIDVTDGLSSGSSALTLVLQVPDLYVLPGEWTLTPPVLRDGDAANTSLPVHTNLDVGVSNPVVVRFEMDGSPLGDILLAPFAAGEARDVNWSFVAVVGPHTLCAIVDPLDDVPESDEANNQACIGFLVRGPDLYLLDAELQLAPSPPEAGSATNATALLHAGPDGNVSVPVTVRFLQDGLPLGDAVTGPLTAGESRTVNWTFTTTLGVHTVCAVADPDNALAEMNDANNSACVEFFARGPDLTSANASLSDGVNYSMPDPRAIGYLSPPLGVARNATAFLTLNATNVGNGTAPPFTITFTNVSGPGGPAIDPPLCAPPAGPLAPAAVSAATCAWVVPATGIEWWVEVSLDSTSSVEEFDESNNTFTFHLYPLPGPYTSLVVGAPNWTVGGTFITSSTNLSFNVTEDPMGNGLAFTEYRVDGGFWGSTSPGIPFNLSGAGEGTHLLEYRSGDNAGSVEPNKTAWLTVDDSPPLTTLVAGLPSVIGAERWITSLTPLTLQAVDAAVGTETTRYRVLTTSGWTDWNSNVTVFNVSEEGAAAVEFHSVDRLGNNETVRNETVWVDNTGPGLSVLAGTPNASAVDVFVTSATPISILAVNLPAGGVGMDSISYRLRTTDPWTPYAPFFLPAEGSWSVQALGFDLLGNVGVGNAGFIVDNTPPTTTVTVGAPRARAATADPWNVTVATPISLAATDDGDIPVGLARTRYAIDGGAAADATGSVDLTGLADSGHTLSFWSEDALGNAESAQTLAFVVDNEPPQTTSVAATAPGQTTVTLDADDVRSGVNETRYSLDGGPWQTYLDPLTIAVEGDHTLRFYSTDRLGNREPEKWVTIRVSGGTGEGPQGANWKPTLAAAFVAILLGWGWLWWRRSGRPAAFLWRWVLPFALAEAATGAASLLVLTLAIPPVLGAGLALDAALLGSAMTVMAWRAKAHVAGKVDSESEISPPVEDGKERPD